MLLEESSLEAQRAYNPLRALWDARARSNNNASHYTNAQKTEATRVQLGLDLCYSERPTYVTYRKKFIAIKVTGTVRDKAKLLMLEEEFAVRGYKKIKTPQGTIYRIPKQ